MNAFQKIILSWQKIGLVHRALLIAVFLTLGIVSGLLFHWAKKPDLRLLYHSLAPYEASKITEKINAQGIQYELKNGGTSIYVPAEKVYQLRLDMAKEGLPEGKQIGYKLFDNEKIGVSPFVQNVNLQRALQDELAKSIQMIDGVAHARVHIANPKQSVFESSEDSTTASVVLQLKASYRMSSVNIAAISNLVAGSVEKLKPENITIIDSQGRLLSTKSDNNLASSGANSIQDYKERVETNLAKKIEDMLTTALGPGRASVKVSADIDMTSSDVIKETYDPLGKAVKKEEINNTSQIEPSTVSSENKNLIPGGQKKEDKITTDYLVGKTIERKTDLPGEVNSIKVAAVVDLSVSDANGSSENAKIMQVTDVQNLIISALGLKSPDSITVVEAKFYRPQIPLENAQKSNWSKYIAMAKQASLGVMAICALFVLRIFTKAGKKTAAEINNQLAEGGPQSPASAGMLLPGSSESAVFRKQIAGAMQNNPEQVKNIFTNWLAENEE